MRGGARRVSLLLASPSPPLPFLTCLPACAQVDISYGGENGFNQAISLAADALANVKFTEERALIQGFFDEITMDSGALARGGEEARLW